MPGDRLPFSVGIGCEVDDVDFFGRFLELFDDVLFIGHRHIGGLEIVLNVDSKLFLGQIADMTDRRLKGILWSQKLPKGFDFRR